LVEFERRLEDAGGDPRPLDRYSLIPTTTALPRAEPLIVLPTGVEVLPPERTAVEV